MFHKIRFTWISYVQLAAILCSLPITILLGMDGISTWIADYKFSKAVEMAGIGNYSGATDRVDATLESVEGFLPALEMKAKIQLLNNDYAQAGQTYNEILQRDPSNANAKLGLAAVTVRENQKKFTEWMDLRKKDPAAAAPKREELDRLVEKAKGQVKQAIEAYRSSGGGKHADAQVYLGLTFLMEDREKNPAALEVARKELEKALPAANPQSAEIPSLDAAIQLANGLGYVAYLESLALWAKVDELKKAYPPTAEKMRAPARLDNNELQVAANVAAEKSYEAVSYFLSAASYGRLWRDAFVNFEMAMCEYLPREELATTKSTKDIEKFLVLGENYLAYKEALFSFWSKVMEEATVFTRLEINDANKPKFSRNSYPFAMAMSQGFVIAQQPGKGSFHLSVAEGTWHGLPTDHPMKSAHFLLNRSYVNANVVDYTPALEYRVIIGIFQQMEGDAARICSGEFDDAKGATSEAKSWAWAALALAQFRHHGNQKRWEPLANETLNWLDDEHAFKYAPEGSPHRDWLVEVGVNIAQSAINNSKDPNAVEKAQAWIAKYKTR